MTKIIINDKSYKGKITSLDGEWLTVYCNDQLTRSFHPSGMTIEWDSDEIPWECMDDIKSRDE